jgi:hypothetical protein
MSEIRFVIEEDFDHANGKNRVRLVLQTDDSVVPTGLVADDDYDLLERLAVRLSEGMT